MWLTFIMSTSPADRRAKNVLKGGAIVNGTPTLKNWLRLRDRLGSSGQSTTVRTSAWIWGRTSHRAAPTGPWYLRARASGCPRIAPCTDSRSRAGSRRPERWTSR